MRALAATPSGRRTIAVAVAGALCLGLATAPAAFSMFERAPKGGTMIDEFRPYMDDQVLADFRRYLDVIGKGDTEAGAELLPALASRGEGPFPAAERLHTQWPAIDREMDEMLDDLEANLDNFRAVDALPPFPLFPWFFVLPGLIGVVLAAVAIPSHKAVHTRILVALGIGLIAAPAIFQMFTRAPLGGQMIDEFRPLMTQQKVSRIQGYFLVIGAGEGELRTRAIPVAPDVDVAAIEALGEQWPTISNEMAPMIGAMADNLDNYAAVAALPAFELFPWMFVVPGILVAGLGLVATRSRRSAVIRTVGTSGRVPRLEGADHETTPDTTGNGVRRPRPVGRGMR